MFNTLLVPLDGSELAERALPYAVRLAAERGGRLVLTRAALARGLVELHGGRVWVESTPGHGSTFRIALPVD